MTAEIVRLVAEYSRDFRILPYDGIHVATAAGPKTEEIVSAEGGWTGSRS